MCNAPLKVLYIAGPSRSGSTFLSNILGEVDGLFNAGELIDIWDRGLLADGACGCSKPVGSCQVWQAVMHQGFAGGLPDCSAMVRWRDHSARSFRLPWLLTAPAAQRRLREYLCEYCRALSQLYEGIRSGVGCRCIVDSSKNVGYANVLRMIPELRLYLLHLVRDPRATAFSWQRKKKGLWQESPAKVALTWLSRNAAAEMLGRRLRERYLRLRYEDFVLRPRESIQRILCLAEERPQELPFIADDEVALGVNHTIYGNPGRLRSGTFRIRLDDEWQTKMRVRDRLLVSALTSPMLLKYGYAPAGRKANAER